MIKVEKDESNTIYFHFNTVESKLSIASFNQMVDSINTVANNVSKVFVGEQAKCTIYILPPEDGSFKSTFLVVVLPIALGLCTTFGDGFIEGLTGHDLKYYGKKSGELVKDATVGIFSKSKDELDDIIPDKVNLDEAINAKSKFYSTIINDTNVLSLGFSDTDKTKIKKADMVYYISPDKIRNIDNNVEYARLKVIKAVLVKSPQAWSLKDINKKRSDEYRILDENFTSLVWDGKNPLKVTAETDEILARVEYVKEMKNGKITTKETNITDVYQFNGRVLKELPEDFELNVVKIPPVNSNNQLSLFDQHIESKDEEDA